jgi:NRPS condensation-like uncharacterized protein
LEVAKGTYCHDADSAPEVTVVTHEASPERCLNEHLSNELNRRFERPFGRPFRFSVIEAGSEAHYVNTIYDHWVADSVAMRLILRHVLGRYLGIEDPQNEHPLRQWPGTLREVFGERLGVTHTVKAAARAITRWPMRRRVAQVPYYCGRDMTVSFELHPTAPGTPARLLQFARSLNATVQDVILAALSRAMMAALPRRAVYRNRDLAMASMVDTRADAQQDLSESLGLFLAYYVVRCRPDQHTSLAELTQRIATETGRIKSQRRYFDALVDMKLVGTLWPWMSERVRPYFMRAVQPMTAGISNVRLCDTWINRYRGDQILDFSRGASTGPGLPLLLTPTTLDDTMNIAVTYRTTGFSRAKIDGVMARVLEQIEHPDCAT